MPGGFSRNLIAIIVSSVVAAAGGPAQVTVSAVERDEVSAPRPLTREVLYSDEPPDYSPELPRGLRWEADGLHYVQHIDGVPTRIETQTGEVRGEAVDAELRAALRASGRFDDAAIKRLSREPIDWSDDRARALLEHAGRHYVFDRGRGELWAVTRDGRTYELLTLGPAGRIVVFVRDHDLYAIDADSGRERRLTRGGGETLLNGKLDWVYQEEIYGRGNWRGFWISPDDRHIAYLQLDESRVPVYSIVRQFEGRPQTEQTRYPKAGDPNPVVRVGVVPAGGGATEWVDLSRYDGAEILVTQASWSPDGRLILAVQDREQTWLDLLAVGPGAGVARRLLREAPPGWIEPIRAPYWLSDGSFLWISPRSGHRHLYHYSSQGRLLRQVTDGPWEVRELHGVTPGSGQVYFSGLKDTPLERHAYRVSLSGVSHAGGRLSLDAPPERLTELGYDHDVEFDAAFTAFFDTYGNVTTPTRVALRRADGRLVRMLSEGGAPALSEYIWSPPRIVRLRARDGFPLHGRLIMPPEAGEGFAGGETGGAVGASKRYPVWVSVYGGPGSQTVRNRWDARLALDQYLAQQGYVVWDFDPRSGGGHGAAAEWRAYKRLGQVELRDIEDGVRWLIDEGIADPQRIGITGHSYGGYMTAYALTHSKLFALGVAGAPVTDWRNYDTIYTERYMLRPQDNPEGYDAGSAVVGAADLHGRLLLVHGLIDDNVHFQNTAQMIEALQKAGKQFDLMIYPRDRHGIWAGRDHYRALTLDYVLERL